LSASSLIVMALSQYQKSCKKSSLVILGMQWKCTLYIYLCIEKSSAAVTSIPSGQPYQFCSFPMSHLIIACVFFHWGASICLHSSVMPDCLQCNTIQCYVWNYYLLLSMLLLLMMMMGMMKSISFEANCTNTNNQGVSVSVWCSYL